MSKKSAENDKAEALVKKLMLAAIRKHHYALQAMFKSQASIIAALEQHLAESSEPSEAATDDPEALKRAERDVAMLEQLLRLNSGPDEPR
jgi:hypothetical protein